MFVAQQADRARRLRLAFVGLCLAPAVVLAGVGAWRHSPLERESFRRRMCAVLGVDVSIGAMRHLRPGTVALERLVLGGDARHAGLSLPQAELEVTSREVRLRTGAAEIGPAGAALLVRLARAWLFEPGRFGRDVVIEIGAVAPVVPGAVSKETDAFPLRAECVAAADARAIRLAAGAGDAEGLLVQSFASGADLPGGCEVSGSWMRGLPVGIVAACLDWTTLPSLVGPQATIAGTFTTHASDGGRSISLSGVIDGVDLAACVAGLPIVAEGTVRVDVERASIVDGRIVEAAARLSGGGGSIGRATLDTVAAALGGRVIAAPTDAPEARLRYDALRLRAVIDEHGAVFEVPGGGGALVAGGQGLLDVPTWQVPVSRLAWALSPEASSTVPATRQSAWLLSVMPLPRAATVPPPASGPRR